ALRPGPAPPRTEEGGAESSRRAARARRASFGAARPLGRQGVADADRARGSAGTRGGRPAGLPRLPDAASRPPASSSGAADSDGATHVDRPEPDPFASRRRPLAHDSRAIEAFRGTAGLGGARDPSALALDGTGHPGGSAPRPGERLHGDGPLRAGARR